MAKIENDSEKVFQYKWKKESSVKKDQLTSNSIYTNVHIFNWLWEHIFEGCH